MSEHPGLEKPNPGTPTLTLTLRGKLFTCYVESSGVAAFIATTVALLNLEDPRVDKTFMESRVRLSDTKGNQIWPIEEVEETNG